MLAQVDCQHRLGHLSDLDVELPFMCFIGLTEREEMEVFNVINSKAKGLSTSLLDFHDAQLATRPCADRPELFIALHLKNEPSSPWYRQLDLGGTARPAWRGALAADDAEGHQTLSYATRKSVNALDLEMSRAWSSISGRAVVIVLRTNGRNRRKHMLDQRGSASMP